jgi:DHA2 family multidrug resistance protein
LNAEVTRQAAMVAYIDDFLLMAMIIVACLPLLLLVRVPPAGSRRRSGLATAAPASGVESG